MTTIATAMDEHGDYNFGSQKRCVAIGNHSRFNGNDVTSKILLMMVVVLIDMLHLVIAISIVITILCFDTMDILLCNTCIIDIACTDANTQN